jgi:RNA polymerase sigma-70 factor (ECF subfamily)
MDDEQLVEMCRSGDGDAFAALLTRYQGGFYSLALRYLGDREDAMDALQDASVKAWRAIGSLRGAAFRSWMNSIVVRTCIDRARARRDTRPLEDDEGRVIPLPDPGPGPEATAMSQARIRSIDRALHELSPEHRAIVLMRDLTDMSYKEIATTLRVPMGTVRSRLARARMNLQERLLSLDPDILEAKG